MELLNIPFIVCHARLINDDVITWNAYDGRIEPHNPNLITLRQILANSLPHALKCLHSVCYSNCWHVPITLFTIWLQVKPHAKYKCSVNAPGVTLKRGIFTHWGWDKAVKSYMSSMNAPGTTLKKTLYVFQYIEAETNCFLFYRRHFQSQMFEFEMYSLVCTWQ